MKEVVVKKDDYEIYSIPVSWKISGKKRKNFFYQELEKLHPRFSPRFFVKKKYSIKKGRLCAEVLVMDKYRLDKLEKENPGKKLKAGDSGFLIYSGKTFYKWCGLFFLLILAGLALTVKGEKKGISDTQNYSVKKELVKMSSYPYATEVTEQILNRVYENKGMVSSYRWADGVVSFEVEDCRPEEIVFDKACSVSYANGSPVFSTSFSVGNKDSLSKDNAVPVFNFHKEMRSAIKNYGAVLQVEKIESQLSEFKFFVQEENLSQILKNIAACLNKSFWHESKLTLERSASGIFINAVFSKGVCPDYSVLEILASYGKLFFYPAVPKLRSNSEKNEPLKISIENPGREIIGQIKKKSGAIYNFWKYKDGRIVAEEVAK